MIRSIYVKNILNYFLVISLSLVFSFKITSLFFQNKVKEIRENEILNQAKGTINLYQNLDQESFNKYLESNLSSQYEIFVYDQKGLLANTPKSPNLTKNKKIIHYVLNGNNYRHLESITRNILIGLPFQKKHVKYALFIKPSLSEQISQIHAIILTALLMVLCSGVILIFITTRFLVKPLVHITTATKELAKGNFNIHLNVKSKDEIGQLAESFNFMAAELDKTEQIRKDFVANVSHEIQSPLTSIRGMAIALKDNAVDKTEEKHYFELIEQESERLSSLAKQLLNLSMLEANKSPFKPKRYLLDKQLRNQLAAMQTLWMEKNLEVDCDLPKLEVFADETLMNQVWTNLYSNAIKYNESHGKIMVHGIDHLHDVEVLITNTGLGIPAKDLPHIFERFYRGEKAHTRNNESYGLGLAVVKRILDLHEGKVFVESLEGQMTTFRIFLKK